MKWEVDIHCEENRQTKNEPGLDDFSLFRLQILKWRASWPKRYALEKKLRMWLDNLCLTSLKDQKVQVFSHIEGFWKRFSVWLRDHISNLNRSQNQKWNCFGDICEGASCLIQWISETHMRDPQSSWEFYTRKNSRTWTERDRENMKWKKVPQDFQNSTGKKQADKTTQLKTGAVSPEKGKMSQRTELGAQRAEPWAAEYYS